jgi:hypothetical protein
MLFGLVLLSLKLNYKFSTFPQAIGKRGLWKCGKLLPPEVIHRSDEVFHNDFHNPCGKQLF